MKSIFSRLAVSSLAATLMVAAAMPVFAGRGGGGPPPNPTLGLTNGFIDLDTPDFKIQLVKDSQTIAALEPKGVPGYDYTPGGRGRRGQQNTNAPIHQAFDFTPNDQMTNRQADRFYHLGDLTFRVRETGTDGWKNYSTAASRAPVKALKVSGKTLASADLAATLGEDCPLQVTRTWVVVDGKLVLKFDLKNKSAKPVEIGALGIPLIFNNNAGYNGDRGRVQNLAAFSDPAIGLDGGFVQVTRLNGKGPSLLVVPEGKTPLEAYEPLQSDVIGDRTPLTQTFEMFYEWMVHSAAYASNEWRTEGDRWVNSHGAGGNWANADGKAGEPWNKPTSETLAPGATKTYGLRFLVSPEIRTINKTLAENNRPVAVGVPGYIMPMDLDAQLFLKYPKAVKTIVSEPAGAIVAEKSKEATKGWARYTLKGKAWGRANMRIEYTDGLVQTISYTVTKPAAAAFADVGKFLYDKAWFTDTNDPFHRAPSVMTYDRGHEKIVLQDPLTWKAGLQDEGGSGGWVSAAMKQFGLPDRAELDKQEQFVDGVLWGGIQYKEGDRKYTVVNSMFYYDSNAFPNYYALPSWSTTDWTKWDKERALTGGRNNPRAYNYPHVVAAYWSMYRLARNNNGLVKNHPWDWYLEQAYQTVYSLTHGPMGYLNVGLMEGDVFVFLLQDLKREGWTEKATEMETTMKVRADRWNRDPFPFGSEMAWDSTGQPEVYAWTTYFGFNEKAQVCLDSILGYMPTIPSWGYDGNARRYWDFYFGAAPPGQQERQIHHYGSGINAVPLLSAFRSHPDDLYLLHVGYAGGMGALSAIDKDGFPSAAFHANPAILKWDTYTGDCSPQFFSLAVNSSTYVVKDPELGWLAYGGNLKSDAGKVTVTPLDAFRMRVYVAPAGLWLTLDAGKFESVEYNPATKSVRVELAKATEFTPEARLRVEQPAKVTGVGAYAPKDSLKTEREAFVVPLKSGTTWVELSAK